MTSKADGKSWASMLATEVALPAAISGNRFSGKSVDSPKMTRPEPLSPSPPPLSLLPPPQADSTMAPAMPVLSSAAPRLLDFTFDCLPRPAPAGGSDLVCPAGPEWVRTGLGYEP